jgi:intracellular sulfur oxidation DsrE/DsrF family protein
MSESPLPVPRRDFLGALVLAGASLAGTRRAHAVGGAAGKASAPAPQAQQDEPWDNSWLDRLTARHRQIFDIPIYKDGGGLFYAKNYLNALRDAYGAQYPDVQAVLGIHGDAYPVVFADAIWDKYEFGKLSKTKDPRSGKWARRNVLWQAREGEETAEYTVDALQSRGAQFLLCNNVLRFVTQRLAEKAAVSTTAMRAELIAGLLPKVIVVPAMVVAIGLAQEHGCAYVYAVLS